MPSGLAYEVYTDDARQAPQCSLQERTLLPNVPSPASPPKRSEPSALAIANAKTVTRRVRSEGHNPSRSCECTHRPGSPQRKRRDGTTGWKPLAEISCSTAGNRRSRRADLAPPSQTSEPGANTVLASCRGIRRLFIGASLTPVLPPPCASHLGARSSTRPDWTEPLRFGDNKPPLSILSVGYTHAASGRPLTTQAFQRKRRAVTSGPQPVSSGRCGVRPELDRDVAATVRAPQTLPNRRLRVPSERVSCRMASHRHTLRFGRNPKSPRRASPVPVAAHEPSLGKSNVCVGSRRTERVATLVAEQHVTARRRRPNSAGSRFPQIEIHARRSLTSFGGLGANADANRRLHNRRLDATVDPHDVETGDVTTTAPTTASREAMGVRRCSTYPARRARVSPRPSHHSAVVHATSSELGVAAFERRPLRVFSWASTAVGRNGVATAA
jgi:hypothetical protein